MLTGRSGRILAGYFAGGEMAGIILVKPRPWCRLEVFSSMNSFFLFLVAVSLVWTGDLLAQAVPALRLSAPYEFSEGEGALALGVDLPSPASTDTVVTVTASMLTPASQQITIPAGLKRGYLLFLIEDDKVIQGPRQSVLRASAAGYQSALFVTLIRDDDVAKLGLQLPAGIKEGGAGLGELSLSQAAGYPVVVSLTAAGGLSLPAEVTIPAGFTRYGFRFSATQDTRINEDFAVSVQALMAAWGERAEASVVVANDDLRILAVDVPGVVFEDAVGLSGKVRIPGTLEVPLVVSLSSKGGAALGVPATVTIPAGAMEVGFALTPTNDPLATGVRVAVVAAEALDFARGQVEISVLDATLAQFGLSGLPEWAAMGSAASVSVQARNVDGVALLSYGEALEAVWEKASSGEALGAVLPGSFRAGEAQVEVLVPDSMEGLRLRLSSGGLTVRSGEVRPYRMLEAKAAAMEVDRLRQRLLYTSGPGAGAGLANTLVAVDPATGAQTPSAFIGSDPRGLAVTDDGAFAYVGLWSSGQMVQYNLATRAVVRSFVLSGSGFPWNSYSFFPVDVECVPGMPEGVMVAQQATGSTYNTAALYRHGGLVAGQTTLNYGSLARSGRPGVIYGFNGNDTGFDFGTLLAREGGVTLQRSAQSPFAAFGVTLEASGDLVIGSNGVVADGQTLLGRGRLALPAGVATWAVEADAAARRFYAAEASQGLFVFDAASLQLVSRVALPPGMGAISQIKRWGDMGVALRLASGAVVLLKHPDVAPTGPAADVAVAFAETDGTLWENQPREFALVVRNAGPNPARAVRAMLVVPAAFSLSGIQAGEASTTLSGNTLTVRFGDLAPGASGRVKFSARSGVLGPQVLVASLLTDSIDPDISNDGAELPVSVLFEDRPNTAHVIPLNALDVVVHPSLPLVYVAMKKEGEASTVNRVLEIDARSGRVVRRLSIGQSLGAMAITDGGEYLYVALGEASQVLRIDLATFAIAEAINLPSTPYTSLPLATDLVALEGQPNSFAVALSYYGIYIMDGAVARSAHTGVYDGSRIERGPSADVLFTYDDYTSGFEFTRLRLKASGAAEEGQRQGFGAYGVDFVSSEGFALSSNGYLIDGRDLSLRGMVPGMNTNAGLPALEMSRQRAYVVLGNALTSFDTTHLAPLRKFALPASGLVSRKALRWGADGFAILQGPEYPFFPNGEAGRLLLVRSDLVPGQAPYDIDFLVDGPLPPAVVRRAQLALSGQAFSAQGIGSVTVNGLSAGGVDALGRWQTSVSLAVGENELRLVATTAGAAPVAKEIVLRVTYTPLLPLDWVEDKLPGEVLSEGLLVEDRDADGWNTLAEFALGGDPRVAQGSLIDLPEAAEPMVFSFWRPLGARAASVVMRLQVSRDLGQWRSPSEGEVAWLSPGPPSPDGHYGKARFRLGAAEGALYWRLWIGSAAEGVAPGMLVP